MKSVFAFLILLAATVILAAPPVSAQNPVLRDLSCQDAGTTDSYACSAAVCPSAYVTGATGHYRFKANTVNTGPANFTFCSIAGGAKTIKKMVDGVTSDLSDGDISAGQWVELVYDGTNMQCLNCSSLNMSSINNALRIKDEFCGGNVTSNIIGELGWSFTGGSTAIASGTANHPCIVQRSTSATINTITYDQLGNANSAFPFLSISGIAWHMTWIIAQDAASTNPTTQVSIKMGLFTAINTDPPANGIYFENLTTTSAAAWSGVVKGAGTSTSGGATNLDTSFHRFEITNDGADNIKFFIDGVQYGGTVSTNIPTQALVPGIWIKNTEAAAKLIDLDAFSFSFAVTR